MKKKVKDLTEKELMETLDSLYTAASSVTGRTAMKNFLKDLLTPSERIMLGRRIMIARKLLSGESQAEIGVTMKVGPNTIWRVERWLQDQMPGYEKAIAGIEAEAKKRLMRRELGTNPFGWSALKKRYPLHFLLFPNKKFK